MPPEIDVRRHNVIGVVQQVVEVRPAGRHLQAVDAAIARLSSTTTVILRPIMTEVAISELAIM